ncbi:MAG: hypothetical protein NXI32_28870 [bacterium]|nr:hypothetical protein [bacterium]
MFRIFVTNPDGSEQLFNQEPYNTIQLSAFAETCAAEFKAFRVENVPSWDKVYCNGCGCMDCQCEDYRHVDRMIDERFHPIRS